MVSYLRILLPVLLVLWVGREADSATPTVDLTPYLLGEQSQEDAPHSFQLGFSAEVSHQLLFRYRAEETVELEVSLAYPAGGARVIRRQLEPEGKDTQQTFDLGPLLGHGPYRPLPAEARNGPPKRGYLPTGWWMDTHDPGTYLLTVKGRRVKDGQILFTVDLRLPAQTWIGADLDRLAYIDDNRAEVELWLEQGAPIPRLQVTVDLVGSKTEQTRSAPVDVRLTTGERTRVPFDLRDLGPATYHVRVRPRIDGRLWEDGIRRALYLHRNGPPPKPDPPLEIPVAPQLFVDDFLIEQQSHIRRVFHPARKLGAPLIKPDRPWERHKIILPPGSLNTFNQDKQRFEFVYSSRRHQMLAVSKDLHHWSKPNLGLVEFRGSKDNNILRKLEPRGTHVAEFGGLWDYRTRGAPDLRTAKLVNTPQVKNMHFQRGTYLMVRDRRGIRYVTSERPFMSRHLQLETLDSPTDNLGPMFYDERIGELVLYFAAHPPSHGRALVRYDNKWAVSRNLGRMTTRDGVNWTRRYIWAPPRNHPKHQSYGMGRVKQMGDLYIAFFPLYDCGTQQIEMHLWVSRNGIHWEDLGGDEPWISNGPSGSFDHGIAYAVTDERVEGDRTLGLYHGANTRHFNAWLWDKLKGEDDWPAIPESEIFDDKSYAGRPFLSPPAPTEPGWALYDCVWSWRRCTSCSPTLAEVREAFWAEIEANTGQTRADHLQKSLDFQIVPALIEFRTDGFVSRTATERQGTLTTHPLVFTGSRLTVNAAASRGQVTVEVIDESGKTVPGFGREDCRVRSFDSTQQEIQWTRRADLSSLRGQPVRLRFYLQHADLYGFQIR